MHLKISPLKDEKHLYSMSFCQRTKYEIVKRQLEVGQTETEVIIGGLGLGL